MDHARRFQPKTTDGCALSKAAGPLKATLLAFALAVGGASTETAFAQTTVVTNSTWLATNAAPAAGWNTNPSFDTTGWINAFVITPDCANGADCIWYDGQNSATQSAWLRTTFNVSGPVSTAVLVGGIDDDCQIYVNGNLAFNDTNGTAQTFGPIDVSSYVVPGVNLIAVAVQDNPVFGQQHAFEAALTVTGAGPTVEVPTLSPWMLGLLACALASIAVLFIVRKS